MKLVKLKQGTKDWLDWRRSKIMASESSVILQISPYKTPDELLNEKVRGFEVVPNHYMTRGTQLEPVALEFFELETGLTMFPMIGQSVTCDWMGASFDGVSLDRKHIVEIKCNGKKNHSLALQGKITSYHNAQVQHQIYVSELDFSYYYSFDGERGVVLKIQRDDKFIENMIEKEKEFWDKLMTSFKI